MDKDTLLVWSRRRVYGRRRDSTYSDFRIPSERGGRIPSGKHRLASAQELLVVKATPEVKAGLYPQAGRAALIASDQMDRPHETCRPRGRVRAAMGVVRPH
jgi:hypothetical protein